MSEENLDNQFESALKVNDGIEQPSQVDENAIRLFKAKRKKQLSVDEYVDGILKGNRIILSQAITLVESSLHAHKILAQQIIERCLPYSGNSFRIGITGVPGVGKSTFIEAFGTYLTSMGHKLAVLAIDPSSSRSRGSILGDKTRMEDLSIDPNAFIRPSPSAGSLGGVARKTRESIILCEAAGFDIIFIETVGVGQSETAVHSMVDFFLLLMLAGAGDELQGIKRGIMEMADAIVINKADGDNLLKAQTAKVEYQNALHLFPTAESGWNPEVETMSARKKEGMDRVWDIIQRYREHV
ncbi:MAG: methylmalonyl Co-A mutase-associated GTPase MeaB, partial [Bacteroidota bacterium]|nr:methylmalonyl Co-A mutase-associated GTPase MeaB [Bacteroidota bacterium]